MICTDCRQGSHETCEDAQHPSRLYRGCACQHHAKARGAATHAHAPLDGVSELYPAPVVDLVLRRREDDWEDDFLETLPATVPFERFDAAAADALIHAAGYRRTGEWEPDTSDFTDSAWACPIAPRVSPPTSGHHEPD